MWSTIPTACLKCFFLHLSYAGKSWDEVCELYRSKDPECHLANERAGSEHFGKYDLPPNKASQETAGSWEIQVAYDVYNEAEFTDIFRVAPQDIKISFDGELPNDEGDLEPVIIHRRREPRRLIFKYKQGVKRSDSLIYHHIRPGQAKSAFDFAFKSHLKNRLVKSRPKKRRRLMTRSMIEHRVCFLGVPRWHS